MQDPGQKGFIDVLAEYFAVDFDLGLDIEHVGRIDVFDSIGEGCQIGQNLLVFRVHQGKEEGIDPLLDVIDLVHAVALIMLCRSINRSVLCDLTSIKA